MEHYLIYAGIFVAGVLVDHFLLPKVEADVEAVNAKVKIAAEDVAEKL